MPKSTARRSTSRRATRSSARSTSLVRRANHAIDRSDNKAEGKIRAVSARLQSGIASVKARAKGVARAVGKQASRADRAIRAKPYHSIGVAAGAALVAGYLISRKRPAAAAAAPAA